MKLKLSVKNLTTLIFIGCVTWEIIFFVFAAKQAYMQGVLESWYTSKGLLYYRDIANAYLPFLKLVMYLFHQVVGYSLVSSVFLSVVFHLVSLVFLFVVSRKWLSGIAQAVPILFFEIWNNYLGGNLFSVTSFLGLLILVSFIFWWSNLKEPTIIKSIACGILFSCSVLTLQIVAPFVFVLSIGLLLRHLNDKKFRDILFFGLGIIIPWLFVFSWVVWSGIASEFLYWNFIYYFGGYPYTSLGKDWITILVFISIHSPLIIFWTSYKDDKKSPIFFTLLALFILLTSFWLAVFHPMRFQISLPLTALLLGMGIDKFSLIRKNLKSNVLAGMVLGLNILCLVILILPSYYHSLGTKNVNRIISEIYPGDPMYDSVEWGRKNIPENARIFVWADTYYYLATQRLPANPRNTLGVEPILFYPLEKFKNEIKLSQPDFWIIDERLYQTYSNWGAEDVSETIKRFLKCQDKVAQFDYWKIYRKNTSSSSCILRQ